MTVPMSISDSDKANPGEIIIDTEVACPKPGDYCFVFRSSGRFTFAKVLSHECGYMSLKLNRAGTTKRISLHKWDKYVRPVLQKSIFDEKAKTQATADVSATAKTLHGVDPPRDYMWLDTKSSLAADAPTPSSAIASNDENIPTNTPMINDDQRMMPPHDATSNYSKYGSLSEHPKKISYWGLCLC